MRIFSANKSEENHTNVVWLSSLSFLPRSGYQIPLIWAIVTTYGKETGRLLRTMVCTSLTVVPYRTIPYCCIKSLHVKKHTRFYSTKNGDKVILHQDNFRLHHRHCITSSIKNIIETMNISGFLWQLFLILITHWLNVLIAVHFS